MAADRRSKLTSGLTSPASLLPGVYRRPQEAHTWRGMTPSVSRTSAKGHPATARWSKVMMS